jgi:gluconate 2-dehydrogenase gamma chain
MNENAQSLDRRRFLGRMAALGLIAHGRLALALDAGPPAPPSEWASQTPWTTLAAVLAHMLPRGEDVPGADDIHAIVYLHDALENPAADAASRARIVAGAERTEAVAQERYQHPFTALDEAQREAVLRRIENEPGGQRWQSTLLTFLLEGLLADPVYGGNFEQAGWRWLRHQPGFPRPPADKTWYRLAPPVQRRSKAT